MKDVSIDRLSLAGRGLIFYPMKKAIYHAPTEELYAFEKRAREERARYVAGLFTAAATALKFRFERAVSALSGKDVRHA
jgi:hypothetical protein